MVGSGLPNPQPGPRACADLSAAPLLPGGSKGIGLLAELPAVSLLLPDLESGKGPSSSQEPHLFDVLRVPLRDELRKKGKTFDMSWTFELFLNMFSCYK